MLANNETCLHRRRVIYKLNLKNAAYKIILQKIKQLLRLKALYKGLYPKILRLGPGGAIMMIAYEEIYKFLKKEFS